MNEVRSRQELNEQALAFGAVLVEEFNPEEAELYAELIASYRSPAKAKKNHPLGIGLGEIVEAISPFFFEVGGAVVGGLWAVAQEATEKSIGDALSAKITNWIRRKFAKPLPLALRDRQIDSIMDTVESKVAGMKVPKDTKQKVLARVRGALTEGRVPDERHGG